MAKVLFTLIPLVVATFVAPMTLKHLSNRKARILLFAVLVIYIVGNLYFTLLSRTFDTKRYIELKPFLVYTRLFVSQKDPPPPDTGILVIMKDATLPVWGVILNIILYYPLGYLIPLLFPKLKPKHVILIGCLCSIATEATQYLLKMGWCETDDVIHNTLGTAIGVWVWFWQSKRLNVKSANPGKGET